MKRHTPQESRSARMVALFSRIRRYLGARGAESIQAAAQRVLATTPSWSPGHDVAKAVLSPGDPWVSIEKAAKLARPKLVPRGRALADR